MRNFCVRYRTHGNHENTKRPGGPRKSTADKDRQITEAALSHTRDKHTQVKERAGSNLSIRTIRRRLKEDGIRKWKAANCAKLTPVSAAARLEWALIHADWTVEDWKKITWSDDVSVEKGKDPSAVWIFRPSGGA